ncbi:MAG: CRISPR-associated protein Csx11, partial [Roseiflexaceae bacterium]|nr:CRISPR-associated protein Csx11 [Roseiflexaceae bacterium]
MYQLDILAQHRDALLLAEVAGWVHDWQKCIDMKAASDWEKGSKVDKSKIHQWKKRGSIFNPGDFSSCLQNLTLNLCASHGDLKTIVEIGSKPSRARQSNNLLEQVLGKSHDAAHVEKELGDRENVHLATDWLSSPFGMEDVQPDNLLARLLGKPKSFLQGLTSQSRSDFLAALREVFSEAWGDTRRPINEVTLWDWSSIVAPLYKAELARCVLTSTSRQYSDIAWRLLSVRINGLDYLLAVSSIPDLLARRELLKDAWDRVQRLLEETYPMGLEVYRDENGPVFVVPDIDNLLQNAQVKGAPLEKLILSEFAQGTVRGNAALAISGEIIPEPFADPKPWKGQPASQELPPIADHLKRQPATAADPVWLDSIWQNHYDE